MIMNTKSIEEIKNEGMDQNKKKLRKMVKQKLRERGCRITRQRETILSVVLRGDCASCKEIYQVCAGIDSGIGFATVYRFVNLLEDIGLISSKNKFRISSTDSTAKNTSCRIEMNDHSRRELEWPELIRVIQIGMQECGYMEHHQMISAIFFDR